MRKRGMRQLACIIIMTFALLISADFSVYAEGNHVDLTNAEDTIEQLIEENKDQTPAVSVTVFEKDRDICNVVYGEADRENHIAVDSDTVYEWGSVSKMLVWVSAMQLYEQGKLDLEEDVRTYLPKDFTDKLRFKHPVTMLNLMNHNAGFQDAVWPLETRNLDELQSLGDALLQTEPAQVREPGTTVAYSNWGAAFAGYVVECISGVSFADYVNENIFAPLHMEHSYMRPDVSDNAWAADKRTQIHCYAVADGKMHELGECRAYIHLYPAGGAGGTIADMATFAKAFLCESADCPLFEKPDTLEFMLSPSLTYSDGAPRICHGLMVQEYGVELIGHGGNTSGFSTLLELDLEGKTGFVMMTNKAGDSVYKGQLPSRLYGECDFASEAASNDTVDFAGKYYIGGSVCAGPAKLYNFLSGTLNMKEKNGTYVNNVGITSIVPLSDGTAKVELITGAVYRYHMQKDNQGNVIGLEHKTSDFEKLSTAEIYGNYIALALPAIAFLMLVALLLLHLLSIKKSKQEGCFRFRIVEIIFGVLTLLLGADLFGVMQTYASSKSGVLCCCVALMVLELLMAVCLGFCHCSKNKPTKRVGLMLETICCVIVIVGTCYWKCYQFWGY